jgi:hypothetical protein
MGEIWIGQPSALVGWGPELVACVAERFDQQWIDRRPLGRGLSLGTT